jgi:hypothetical protein
MDAPALRRPVFRWKVVLTRLQSGCSVPETARSTGLTYEQVASAIRDDPLYTEAYTAGQALREARKEVYG